MRKSFLTLVWDMQDIPMDTLAWVWDTQVWVWVTLDIPTDTMGLDLVMEDSVFPTLLGPTF